MLNSELSLDPSSTVGMSMSQSLLTAEEQQQQQHPIIGSNNNGGGEYSMTEYFHTFVMDIYNLFRSLPIPAQGLLVIVLLWIAWKLL